MDEVVHYTWGVNKPIREMCTLSVHLSVYKVRSGKCTYQVVDHARDVIAAHDKGIHPCRGCLHKSCGGVSTRMEWRATLRVWMSAYQRSVP